VLVRDTKDRRGLVLRFTPGAWRRFAGRVKRSLAGRSQALISRIGYWLTVMPLKSGA